MLKCTECKHPISEHADGGCFHEKRGGDLCFCCLEEAEVALALLPKLEAKIKKLEKEITDLQEMFVEESR